MSLVLPDWPATADEGVACLAKGDPQGAAVKFEILWEGSEGHIRRFWQGLLQIAGGIAKADAGAREGALRLLDGGHAKLRGVLPVGAPVHALRFAGEVRDYADALRAGRPAAVPRLWRRGEDGKPGLVITRWPDEAVAGVRRFDAGEYWEAHEHFEAVMAEAPGEEGLLFKGLIHAGSALLKAGRGQAKPALVLAGSARRLLIWLSPVALPDEAALRLDAVLEALEAVTAAAGRPDPVPAPKLAGS
jgi:predicted metal-dependent hydrolase